MCALVNGPAEAHEPLLPFVVAGLEQGDRAFHIVDPALREAHLERLRAAGIDVAAAMNSHQLEVRTWTESYLRGGRFDPAAQLAYMRQALAEGARLGFPLTRLVASLEWADPETMSDLLSYEARLDRVLQKLPDVVVCTYDLNRHGGRAIVEVLGVHPVALIGGVVRTSGGAARASARDRLLAAAAQLFYENGIQATGVDSIIDAAGVAKATFYRHYPSKDDLVAAWLRDPRARWLDRLRAQVEALDAEPAEKIPRFFDALADWLESGGYRGCPYLNAAIEITDPTHPARSVVVDYLQEIEDYLVGLVAAAGYRHPQRLGEQLQALVTGATSLAVARGSSASVTAAREAALRLLNSAERRLTIGRIRRAPGS